MELYDILKNVIKGALLFLLLSLFTFVASIFSHDWLVDHLSPTLLLGFSISAFVYVFFDGIISFFKKIKPL